MEQELKAINIDEKPREEKEKDYEKEYENEKTELAVEDETLSFRDFCKNFSASLIFFFLIFILFR